MRQRRLRHKKHRKDVGPKRALELILRDLLDRLLRVLLGRIVNENVKTAKLSYHTLDRVPAKPLLSDVSGDGHTSTSFLFDQSFRLLSVFVFVQIEDRHIGALSRECDGDSPAHAAVAAPNHGDFLPQLAAPTIARVFSPWTGRHFGFEAGSALLLLRRLLL